METQLQEGIQAGATVVPPEDPLGISGHVFVKQLDPWKVAAQSCAGFRTRGLQREVSVVSI